MPTETYQTASSLLVAAHADVQDKAVAVTAAKAAVVEATKTANVAEKDHGRAIVEVRKLVASLKTELKVIEASLPSRWAEFKKWLGL